MLGLPRHLPPLDEDTRHHREHFWPLEPETQSGSYEVSGPGSCWEGEEGGRLSSGEHEMLRLVLRLMRRHFRVWKARAGERAALKQQTVSGTALPS